VSRSILADANDLSERGRREVHRIVIDAEQKARIAYLPQAMDIDRTFPISVYDLVAMGLWNHAGLFGGIGYCAGFCVATQGAKPGQPGSPGEQKSPTPGEAAPPADQKVGEAPTIPTGQTAAEAAAEVPDTGTIARINVQGNRRVETDAIRAAMPLKAGDAYDREKLKSALLAVWRMGYFNDVKLDVSHERAPATGYVLTVLVSEKPAITRSCTREPVLRK